ncbi:MAG: gamma-glutamyltransferase [Gemmataceae bacterium]|nr:gamma-glutamyltransferase [Gemmataceae bacterium]
MRRFLSALLTTLAVAASLHAQPAPRQAVTAKQGMVTCVSPPAAEAGSKILQKGGNAVDAAVTVAFAMAVTYPSAGNIGGGGFMLIHPPAGEPTVIEYREAAPAAATADMFVKNRDPLTHRAAGVPGTVRGLEMAFKKYGSGKVTWAEVVEPAIQLAESWPLEAWSARSLTRLVRESPKHPEFCRCFGKPGGGEWKAGDILRQPDLAKTLRAIAERGSAGFYTGPVAEMIEKEMKAGGGLITQADLAAYQAKERPAIHGTYRGYDVWGASPPSSGGIGIVEMLNMLEGHDLKSLGADTPARWHLTAEVMKRAFRDRARWIGDPDFVTVPTNLIEKPYARSLMSTFDPNKATPSASLAGDITIAPEPENTTHFSIVDAEGRGVSNTYTLEESYGSRVVVRGAGFILNNEMLDFNHIPGVTTQKGKVGTPANLVAPGKRMLSSQTPTILAKGGKPVLVTGSPGGRTIINTVLCIVTNVVDFDMDVQAAVDFPRIHHQWLPDEIRLERYPDRQELVAGLEKLGHKVTRHQPSRFQGDGHSVWIAPDGTRHGAADRRIMGKAAGY